MLWLVALAAAVVAIIYNDNKPPEVKRGDAVSGLFPATENGRESVEGLHYPQPHTWYATVLVENGNVVKVIN